MDLGFYRDVESDPSRLGVWPPPGGVSRAAGRWWSDVAPIRISGGTHLISSLASRGFLPPGYGAALSDHIMHLMLPHYDEILLA